jgi:hypothetical protein
MSASRITYELRMKSRYFMALELVSPEVAM